MPKMKLENPTSSFAFWYLILLYLVSFMQPTRTIANALSNVTDRSALLKLKESISSDPYGVMSSWNDLIHFCKWNGISCSRRHQRITVLNLQGYKLRGSMSPHIGNLSFLRFIYLGDNSFFSEIPPQVGHLRRLQHLNLSFNMLEGKIPVDLSYSSKLRILLLHKNNLTGAIPFELGSLVKLELLGLDGNNLTGVIPASIGNISSLGKFSVGDNNLVGTIPYEIGKLKRLTVFTIGVNNLSGEIPLSLYNISSMRSFSLTTNHFKGTLPSNIGLTLPNLQEFGISGNEFSGIIPNSFANATRIQIFDILDNYFSGQVPANLGNLPELRWLGLGNNTLGSYSANSWDFIPSLANCSKLEILDLGRNNFGGVLPNSIANLSTQLTRLYLGDNQISGNILATFENLGHLMLLDMWNNLFTGVIPASLGKLQNLLILDLSYNRLSGKIPPSIGNLTHMTKLHLQDNTLEGTLPQSFSKLQNLQFLNISNNSLCGTIPKGILSVSSSIQLDFSVNSFTGNLSADVGKLKNTNVLDFSENKLTNEIPETIGDCQSLEFLSLRGNSFRGIMPSTLASLRGLEYLDFSRNNLTGQILLDLENLPFLGYLNLSFNDLEEEVPKKGVFNDINAMSFVGNTKLCGGIPKLQLPPCPIKRFEQAGKSRGLKLTIIIIPLVAIFLLLLYLLVLYWRRKSKGKTSSTLSDISFLSSVSYKRLYQATNGFSPSMLIGTGSFGSVYKGILEQEESIVAVKVLNLHQKGASKNFIAECNALRNIRHRNLVKVLTCCSSIDHEGNDFKALIYEYMSNGSLDKWLHLTADVNDQSRGLNLIQRLNIAIDVASAVCYLHDHCEQPIIHCDLKPSNVLLDNEMIGHVGDFGLARLIPNTTGLAESPSSTLGIKGTIGYTPPEYGTCGEPSKQGDVYSYGILVLEMFTRRRPTDEMFKDDFNLHNFVKMAFPERLVQILDSSLLPREVEENALRASEYGRNYGGNNEGTEIEVEENTLRASEDGRIYGANDGGTKIEVEEKNINFENQNWISAHLQKCLVSVLEIALACSKESPNERINIGDATRELQHIRDAYTDVEMCGQRRRSTKSLGNASYLH